MKVLVFYDYFDPAYKAGGPVRSLKNLVHYLSKEIDFYVITGSDDHDGSELMVEKNKWVNYVDNSKVAYLERKHRTRAYITELLINLQFDVIYINGVFSFFTTIIPLRLSQNFKIPVIIAPRGMLQSASLSIKPLKKYIYLAGLRIFFLSQKITWHLTTNIEKTEFEKFLPVFSHRTKMLGNIPAIYDKPANRHFNKKNKVTLGTIALISPMKNIHLIIQSLRSVKSEIEYIIYGPVKDSNYWSHCKTLIKHLPKNIRVSYEGSIEPSLVASVMKGFDFYIQPSKSENFGHSIFEAMSLSIPVIISDQTPWKNLKSRKGGWDVDIRDIKNLILAIQEASVLTENEYLEFSSGARRIAEDYMNKTKFKEKYIQLFSF